MTNPDEPDGRGLAALTDQDEEVRLAALRERLADQADRAGILDVAYRTVDSPVGALLLVSTGQGLVRVAYACEGHESVLSMIAEQVSPRILCAPGRLDVVAHELDEYFAGRLREFDVQLDLRLARGFRREVLGHLREVGYGSTASYAVVASASGKPTAVRAVGTACAKNPLPIVVPCHRVVRSDGNLGQYVGGAEAKRTLLALEAAA